MNKLLSAEYQIIEGAFQQLMWMEQKKFTQLLSAHDLTVPQFLVLTLIQQRGTGCPIGALADAMFQSYPTMTGIVDRMKLAGLVEREDDPRDRRKVVVKLTRAGRALLDRAQNTRRERMMRALARFSARDRRELVRLLQMYLDTFEKETE